MRFTAIEGSNILVTGGAGFIGSHLVERLHRDNRVIVLDNLLYGSRENLSGTNHVFVEDDIVTADIAGLIGDYGIDLVFHLATYHLDDSLRDPATDFMISAVGGVRLLEACRQHGVKRFVYASTGSVYGEPKHVDHSESHEILPSTPYGASKAAVDHYCRIYHDLYGLDTVRLRYYNVYGPRRTGGAVPKFMLMALAGGTIRIEGGEQIRTPTYVSDIVDATMRVGHVAGIEGMAFNIASVEEISVLDMAKLIVRMCDAEHRVTMKVTAYRPGEIMRLRPNVDLARRVLGWEARIPLKGGFRRLIDYLRTTELGAAVSAE